KRAFYFLVNQTSGCHIIFPIIFVISFRTKLYYSHTKSTIFPLIKSLFLLIALSSPRYFITPLTKTTISTFPHYLACLFGPTSTLLNLFFHFLEISIFIKARKLLFPSL